MNISEETWNEHSFEIMTQMINISRFLIKSNITIVILYKYI